MAAARRRILPDAGPLTGTAGTARAYDTCARAGCGHARVKHLTTGPCTNATWHVNGPPPRPAAAGTGICQCPGYLESEE